MRIIKYKFAYNNNDDIVDISTVKKEDREIHKYHCISCGAEMVARLGNKNIHHFAHKGGDDSCSVETYLHKLGKYLLKKKFDESDEFLINYRRKSKCSQYDVCKFHNNYDCAHEVNTPINLKQYFDTCSEEQAIGDFRADLLLSDSTRKHKDKILLEIRVSHECTEKKKKSKYRIIEMQVKSEDDLLNLIESTINENEGNKFYNFKKLVNVGQRYSREIPRFFLYPNNKAYVDFKSDCSPIKRAKDDILELIIDVKDKEEAYKFGLAYANEIGINVKNCSICKYFSSILFYPHKICCKSRNFGTPENPEYEYAVHCQHYIFNKNLIKR